tara:strand:+ start:825 stop:1088 length:264 start_codon:yes stop_codon:yes gene_type:complete
MVKIRTDRLARDVTEYQDNPKKIVKRTPKPKAITKLQLIGDVLDSADETTISFTIEEFAKMFSYNQLNRGWTKPQIEFLMEKFNVSK